MMRIMCKNMSKDSDRRCVPWLMVYVACILAFCTEIVDSIILPPIHWNMSNPMFKTSNNDHVINVKMYDELDFICPTFSGWEDSSQLEYYIIYQVSKKEYDHCSILPETKAIMIVNCSSPNQRKRFTILFEPFASIPHVPEFKKGGTYYYISTSTGQRDGITNVQQGACLYRNMKLTITVCCEPTPTPTTTTTTTVTRTSTTRRIPTGRRTTPRTPTSTTSNRVRGTDKVPDRTSKKPVDKEKKPSDHNNVDKDFNDSVNNPKHEGLVNSAPFLHPMWTVYFLLCLFSSLPWLRR